MKATAKARGTSRIIVASFTRAAAAEVAGRRLPLKRDQVGTLHSLAYRAIGKPEVAQSHLEDWNRQYRSYALTDDRSDLAVSPQDWAGASDGDQLLMRSESLRGRMVPRDAWPASVRAFQRRWDEWKAANDLVDFTDMLELALSNTEQAPGNPIVGFVDEAQDLTPLEMALVRHWGQRMDRVVLSGDDDQVLYRFRGATPDVMLDPPLPDEQIMTLSQSYRVPRMVHRAAEHWVRRLSRRQDKEYLPRDEDGEVRLLPANVQDGRSVARLASKVADEGRTVMVLTTCAYMLQHVVRELRDAGQPFHNPYRRARGDWNPLAPRRGTSSVDRLLAYMAIDDQTFGEEARPWTGEDIKKWLPALAAKGVLSRGVKSRIQSLPDGELPYQDVAALFESEEELAQAVEPSLDWFQSRLTGSALKGMRYPLRVARAHGVATLTEEPRIVTGTIHSVKGGEADVVILAPDLSTAGYREWTSRGEPRDSVIRQMYVGMTRAREELLVLSQSGPRGVDPRELMRGVKG